MGLTKFFAGTKKVFNGMILASTEMKKHSTGTIPGLTGMKKVFAGTIPSSTGMKKCLTEMIPAKNFVVPTHPGMNTGDSGLLKFNPLTVKMRFNVLKSRCFWV